MQKVISVGSILGDAGPAFYTVAELATVLRISQFTVRRWVWSGVLDAKMLGTRIRIPRTAVESFLADQNWSPEVSQQRAGRPRLRRRKPEAPARAPEAQVPEAAAAPEPVSQRTGRGR